MLKLEEKAAQAAVELTPEQVAQIEKSNPSFRERHVESSRPGELLAQDTFFVGHLKGVGKEYLHAVIDTYGSYALGVLHTSKQPEAAVAVLHNEALPFYQDHGLTVNAVLTDHGREFCGTESHPFGLYLALNEIEHRRTQVRRPQTNRFIERFNRTVLDELFRTAFRTTLYESVEASQADLDDWLAHYNLERPHQGLPQPRPPADRYHQPIPEICTERNLVIHFIPGRIAESQLLPIPCSSQSEEYHAQSKASY